MYLDELATVVLDTGALGHNLAGEDEVLEDGLVDSGESAGARAGLLLVTVVETARLAQHASLCQDDNVLAAKLLLQLADEARLHAVAVVHHGDRHKDDNGLALLRHGHLLGAGNVHLAKRRLQVIAAVVLKIEQSGGNLKLERIDGRVVGLDNLLLSRQCHFVSASEKKDKRVEKHFQSETKINKKKKR